MDKKRILIAAIFHETHSFVAETTKREDFAIRRGKELLQREGDGSTISGFLEVAGQENWDVVPVVEYSATPSGTIEHAVFEEFWAELENGLVKALSDGGLDGIWLSLHGAMVTTNSVDPEGELLTRIRAIPGAESLPLFAVFDLHATMTKKMADHANGLVGYRENPHIDAKDSAVRSAKMLARSLAENVQPKVFVRNAPIIWAPPGTGTADRPMRDLVQLARSLEKQNPDFWEVSTVAGYAFSDVPDAGVAFSITTTASEHVANQALDTLEQLATELRELGQPDEWDLEEALLQIKSKNSGLHIVVEPADNIGGGAPGDETSVLRGFLRHGFTNSAVIIADASAVAALADAKQGDRRNLKIGGKGSPLGAGPLEAEVEFISRSDGKFTLEDRNSHMVASRGIHIDMGPSAVVRIKDITVLLTSLKTAPNDLGQLRSQGIIPETLFAIGVKAAVAHRRAYDPIITSSYTVRTAGPCSSALTTLPYRRLRQPIFPISHQRT